MEHLHSARYQLTPNDLHQGKVADCCPKYCIIPINLGAVISGKTKFHTTFHLTHFLSSKTRWIKAYLQCFFSLAPFLCSQPCLYIIWDFISNFCFTQQFPGVSHNIRLNYTISWFFMINLNFKLIIKILSTNFSRLKFYWSAYHLKLILKAKENSLSPACGRKLKIVSH